MSSHLKAERQRLLDRIPEIRSSGRVAPPYTFLGETTVVSEIGTTYRYARLVQQRDAADKQETQSLGRVGSDRHRFWQRAIARRDAIAELEMQLSLLAALIERQQAHREWVSGDFSEPKAK
jgi:hypothetical protein